MPPPRLASTWSFGLRGHASAWPALVGGGSGLDAVEAACRVIDADPEIDSVGYGGLPDREGGMTLDGAVMLGPDRCGAVAAVGRYLHPVTIARLVMERTNHIMLAGPGAERFAAAQGLEEAELLSPAARDAWTRWIEKPREVDQSRDAGADGLRPVDLGRGGRLFHPKDSPGGHDTIGVLALDAAGTLAGACSTSGMPYKLPGRVGDSPIIGHGLYVDPAVGAATATGSGELVMGVCGSFLAVERLRAGDAPRDALLEVLRRIADGFTLKPKHQVALVAMTPDGTVASAALRPGFCCSITDDTRHEAVEPDAVLLDA